MSKKRLEAIDSTQTILRAIGESDSGASLRYFSEALDNKSIVLKNTNAQLRASKSSTRAKANAARVGKMSKRGFKKVNKLLPNNPEDYKVEERDVRRTHHLWKLFVSSILKSCTNELQMRTKLIEAGLLGAYIKVVNNPGTYGAFCNNEREVDLKSRQRRRQMCGFVVNESRNCLFLAILPEEDRSPADDKSEGVIVKRVLKAPNLFAVSLPSSESMEGRVVILYGKQFLSLKNGKSFGS